MKHINSLSDTNESKPYGQPCHTGDELDASSVQSTMYKKSKSVVSGRSQSVLPRIPQGGSHDKGS